MKKLILCLAVVLAAATAFADGWVWKPEGTSSIRPVGDKVTAREYAIAATGSLPITEMFGTVSNRGATGTIEIRLSAPTGYREFLIEAWAAQTIEVDFPADANPYLDGAQIGADNEIDVPAGATLRVTYRPSDGTWHCFRVWGLSADGGADD